jgi:hypothetical protein
LQKRGIEENDIEAPAIERREEIALEYLDPLVDTIQQNIDTRAAHSSRIYIYRHDVASVSRCHDSTNARPCSHIQHFGIPVTQLCSQLGGEKLTGAHEARIENSGRNDQVGSADVFEDEAFVALLEKELVVQVLHSTEGGPQRPEGRGVEKRSKRRAGGWSSHQAAAWRASRKSGSANVAGERHIEQTQVAHSGRLWSRMSARKANMASLFKASSSSGCTAAPGGPGMKKHGCNCPLTPTTAENSGALQRTGG